MVDRAALEMRCTGNCTGGSNPSLSAIKGVNQAFARFTPFFTPKNVKLGVFVFLKILQKNVNYKAIGISMVIQKNKYLKYGIHLPKYEISIHIFLFCNSLDIG